MMLRSTAMRLVLVFLTIFAAASAGLILFIAVATIELIDRQMREAIEAEIRSLAEEYRAAGVVGLVRGVERRSIRPGASLYLLTDFAGNRISGNIADLSSDAKVVTAEETFPVRYTRLLAGEGGPERAGGERRAIARIFVLPGGFRLLVGRDIEERLEFGTIIRRAIAGALVLVALLALGSYLFVSRKVLRKIDAIALSGRRIVAGNLGERLPEDGSGDEFDRLAASVNAMLDRIAQLDAGLRDVSDNIAHDLKTPLTRLRNRIEERLRTQGAPDAQTEALLSGVIEESEALIRTFDALLMIARVESVSTETRIVSGDVMAVVRDMAELYEPVAEEAGARLDVDAPGTLVAPINRELVRPMVANLLDNAIKYGAATAAGEPVIRLSVRADDRFVTIRVADNGAGIPAADRERVTGRFVRLQKSRSAPGAGLGLSLVKAVVSYHGGMLVLADAAPGLAVEARFPRGRIPPDGAGRP